MHIHIVMGGDFLCGWVVGVGVGGGGGGVRGDGGGGGLGGGINQVLLCGWYIFV